jgi:hypothetical protein
MNKIYLSRSYASDRLTADSICAKINELSNARGFEVITPGSTWTKTDVEKLQKSDVLIIVPPNLDDDPEYIGKGQFEMIRIFLATGKPIYFIFECASKIHYAVCSDATVYNQNDFKTEYGEVDLSSFHALHVEFFSELKRDIERRHDCSNEPAKKDPSRIPRYCGIILFQK